MASKDALAIRREAAFARIAAAAGIEPPAANRDPDVTLTQFVEWAADTIEQLAYGPTSDESSLLEAKGATTEGMTQEERAALDAEAALQAAKESAGYDQMDSKAKAAWTRAYKKEQEAKAQETENEPTVPVEPEPDPDAPTEDQDEADATDSTEGGQD